MARYGLTQMEVLDAVCAELTTVTAITNIVGARIYKMPHAPKTAAPLANKQTPFLVVFPDDVDPTRNGYCLSTWEEERAGIVIAAHLSGYADDADAGQAQALAELAQTAIYSSLALMKTLGVLQWETTSKPRLTYGLQEGVKSAISLLRMTATYNVKYTIG